MTDTAKQLEAEAQGLMDEFITGLEVLFEAFFPRIEALGKRVEEADIPEGEKLAIATRLEGGFARLDELLSKYPSE